MDLIHGDLTERILTEAVEVHRKLGPGLLESVYRELLGRRLEIAGLRVQKERAIPFTVDGVHIPTAYRADLVVDDKVLVEVKSVERLQRIHEAQIITYLRLSGLKVGLLINFNSVTLRHSIRRFVV